MGQRSECWISKDDAAVKVTTEDRAMPNPSPILICAVWAAVVVISICKAPALYLGQWDDVDPAQREWFDGLMQPDNPNCGLADAYWSYSYEVRAISTWPSSLTPATNPHIENGKRFAVPNSKIKWAVATRPGTALSLSAMVLRSIVTCHPGEDISSTGSSIISRRLRVRARIRVSAADEDRCRVARRAGPPD